MKATVLFRKLKLTYRLSEYRQLCVLGIETSCDDTGLAIVQSVNGENTVLANVLKSQQQFHIRYGGIIPTRAQDLHRASIMNVFESCLKQADLKPKELDAIAVTTRPGLPLSLKVGVRFARFVGRIYQLPLVPVHHMEAHALQARMEYKTLDYPFVCLLISGGHTQLVFVRNASEFLLLGECLEDAAGETFDKIARRLRLYLNPRYGNWNGGQIIEDVAKLSENPKLYSFSLPLARQRNCNFSFAGIKNNSYRTIRYLERTESTLPDGVIRNYKDFCAGLLNAVSRHLRHRTQRALEFCLQNNYFGNNPARLVVSGGVANNDKIFEDLSQVAEHFDCEIYRPSKNYCSDNGVMIAWNAIEKIRATNSDCLRWDYNNIDVEGKANLGINLIDQVTAADIKCKWVQMKNKL